MEQLELFPNQDYEDALAWLTEGLNAMEIHPVDIVQMQTEFEEFEYREATRAELFQTIADIFVRWGNS